MQGFRAIAGVDEVGRGAWAGPLVAAAVILPGRVRLSGVRDSKLLSSMQRIRLAERIKRIALGWSVSVVTVEEINARGIGWANITVLCRTLETLEPAADYVFIDGNIKLPIAVPYESIVDADARIVTVAAASILAKTARDQMMIELHDRFPRYGFKSHMGYGTKAHQHALRAFGPSSIHRRHFAPIAALLSHGESLVY